MKGGLFPNIFRHTAAIIARPPYAAARQRSAAIPLLSGEAGYLRSFRGAKTLCIHCASQ